jgi:hypothetical protein
MASFDSVAFVGRSLERLLNLWLGDAARSPIPSATARLVRTQDFAPDDSLATAANVLSIFLHRIEVNKTTRAGWSAVGSIDGRPHLPLDLHFLLTPWADNAVDEHRIIGATMECLETFPILTGPLLHPDGNWAANEAVQVTLEDLPHETLWRAFDTLPADYRLTVPYIARVVRLDGREATASPDVTALVTGIRP